MQRFWNQWAVNYRNGRLLAALVLAPLLFTMGWCMMGERFLVELNAPRNVTLELNGDLIPKESSRNYSADAPNHLPLDYAFEVDEGTYTLRATDDDTKASKEIEMLVSGNDGQRFRVLITNEDELVIGPVH